MVQTIAGQFVGNARRFAIVQSRFNAFVTDRLRDGCLDTLRRHGVAEDDLVLVQVPGAFEIPLVCQRLAAQSRFDAIIALGAVIRGATPHFDLVAEAVARGVAQVSLASSLPVVFGVITADTIEQALERAGLKAGNKGSDAALTALEMADLFPRL